MITFIIFSKTVPFTADCVDGYGGPLVAGVAVGCGAAGSVITILISVAFSNLRSKLSGIFNMFPNLMAL